MEKRKLNVTVDLGHLTVNIENTPDGTKFDICIRKDGVAGVTNMLHTNDIPRKKGDITWVKLWAMSLHPQNGFNPGDYRAYVMALNESGSAVGEGASEAFHLNAEQIKFIRERFNTEAEPTVADVEETIQATEQGSSEASEEIAQVEVKETVEVTQSETTSEESPKETTVSKAAAEKALKEQKSAFEAQLAEWKLLVEDAQKKNTEGVEKFAALADKLKAEQAASEAKLAETKKAHDAEKQKLQEQHDAAAKKLQDELASGVATVSKENAELKKKFEEEIARLTGAIAAAKQNQPTTSASTAASQTQSPAPANTVEPDGARPTAGATQNETSQQQPENQTRQNTPAGNGNKGRFVWKAQPWLVGLLALLIIGTVGFLFWQQHQEQLPMLQNNQAPLVPLPSSQMTADKAEIMRLMNENNRLKSEQVKASSAPVQPSAGSLNENITVNGTNVSVTLPSKAKSDSGHSITIGQISGNRNKVSINDNRKTIVHPNGWPLDWRPTLPIVTLGKDITNSDVYEFVLPPRGVQAILAPEPGWYIEVAHEDMVNVDVKYGNEDICLEYLIGPEGERVKGNQMRIRPKGYNSRDLTVKILIKSPQSDHQVTNP